MSPRRRCSFGTVPGAMTDDPFKPPQAPLELDDDPGPVPMRVKIAVMAIITAAVMSFALKAAAALGLLSLARNPQASAADILPATLVLLLLGVLAWKIFVGRDWARWIFAAIVAIGVLGLASIYYMPEQFGISVPRSLWVASVIQSALNLTAFVLLFTGDATKWFRH